MKDGGVKGYVSFEVSEIPRIFYMGRIRVSGQHFDMYFF
jgi:hypothetical protein